MHWQFTIPANTTAEVCIPQRGGTYDTRHYGSGTYEVTAQVR